MMYCQKMYRLNLTSMGVLVVRDHMSRGAPSVNIVISLWHYLRRKSFEEEAWKVVTGAMEIFSNGF